jgi:hypothetical protein
LVPFFGLDDDMLPFFLWYVMTLWLQRNHRSFSGSVTDGQHQMLVLGNFQWWSKSKF